jgi:CRP/FNR family transcriptional regulator, polysaccharide utilization system transcription regulator
MGHLGKACLRCENCFHDIFSVLQSSTIAELEQHKTCVTYKKGHSIFLEHSYPRGLYCISFGKIKLSRIGKDGKEQILRLFKGGDILGYRALLSNEPYNASAIVLEDARLCLIDKDYFQTLIFSHPKLHQLVFKKISEDLKQAEEHLISMSQNSVRERVAEALLFLNHTYGYEEDGQTINIKLSREDLANIVGTSTESLIRVLSDFKKEGLIDLVDKKIKFLNFPVLYKMAHMHL